MHVAGIYYRVRGYDSRSGALPTGCRVYILYTAVLSQLTEAGYLFASRKKKADRTLPNTEKHVALVGKCGIVREVYMGQHGDCEDITVIETTDSARSAIVRQ